MTDSSGEARQEQNLGVATVAERPTLPVEEPRVIVMCALDLALDVAYHDGNLRDLAVAAEAWTLAGFWDGSIDVAHASSTETQERVQEARKYRHRALLHADARGMLKAFYVLAENGLITAQSCSEATRLRWVARGGHDFDTERNPLLRVERPQDPDSGVS